MNIILFSGPPRCGKDTAAKALTSIPHFTFDRMSMPIKLAFAAVTHTRVSEWGDNYEYESIKEDVIPLFGVSYRQWQIDFSEKFMKPLYGNDIFARLFWAKWSRLLSNWTVVVPDCGFQIEADYLLRKGLAKVVLVRVHRAGTDFSRDSRGYVDAPLAFDVINNGTVEEFQAKIKDIVKKEAR